jgi:hypothetical protein
MLPKKRKFLLSEFETFNAQSGHEEDNADIGIDLSIRPRQDLLRRASSSQDRNSIGFETPTPDAAAVKSEFQTFDPDLTDWIGHRILARRDKFFSSGVIRNVFDLTSVVVSFDAEDTPIVYHEVLRRENYGCIISDAVPASKQVTATIDQTKNRRMRVLRNSRSTFLLYGHVLGWDSGVCLIVYGSKFFL